MKIILTGGSGFVGGAILRHVIEDDRIDHVFALTRKELPTELAASSKVTVIKHDNFGIYNDDLLEKLAGAEGCLWYVRQARRPRSGRILPLGAPPAGLRACAVTLYNADIFAPVQRFTRCMAEFRLLAGPLAGVRLSSPT
jgi:hypothetical protein